MTTSSRPQEVDSRSRFGSLLAAAAIVITFTIIGLGVSAVWHSATPKVFESDATVLIERRSPLPPTDSTFNFIIRHDQLIGEDNIITKALIKYDLKELPTLRDLSPSDQIHHIQSNLEVHQIKETDNVYHVRFRSPDPRDAQTVLATLVSTYERHLMERYRTDKSDTRALLLHMKKRFAEELAARIEKVDQLEKQIAAGQTGKDSQATLKELQEEVEKIQEKLSNASSQYAQQVSLQKKKKPKGYNFQTLSPASKGVPITPPLYVYLLIGGLIGATIGLIAARLMTPVLRNRN